MTRPVPAVIVGALIGLSIGACDGDSGGTEQHAGCKGMDRACVAIERDDLGAEWPFSVNAGALSCMPGRAITFGLRDARSGIDATGDDAFGLNRAAHERGYPPPYAIWEWDGESPAADLRKSMQPVLEVALELCR